MGRFETTVDFYRHREPYPPEFFKTVAAHMALTKQTRLLDVGCGPGSLAIGFAPFVGRCTAIDPEPAMLRAARAAAAETGVAVTFIETKIEDLDCDYASFDLVTIGRALHWFSRESALTVLERIVAPGGRIAICGSAVTDAPVNAWAGRFKEVRSSWSPDYHESRYRPDLDQWFAPSRFRKADEIRIEHRHRVGIPELISRAVSFSITSPAVLGDRQPRYEAEIQAAVEPFASAGVVDEELAVTATIFG
ncbi:MAG: class I SAM-dependent methyltransferase [Bryobacteraceae bacterium]